MADIVRLRRGTIDEALQELIDLIRAGGVNGLAVVTTHTDGSITRLFSDTIGDSIRMVGGLHMAAHDITPHDFVDWEKDK